MNNLDTKKEKRRRESLLIKLETLKFLKSGGEIQELPPSLSPANRLIEENLGPASNLARDFEMKRAFQENSIMNETTAR